MGHESRPTWVRVNSNTLHEYNSSFPNKTNVPQSTSIHPSFLGTTLFYKRKTNLMIHRLSPPTHTCESYSYHESIHTWEGPIQPIQLIRWIRMKYGCTFYYASTTNRVIKEVKKSARALSVVVEISFSVRMVSNRVVGISFTRLFSNSPI